MAAISYNSVPDAFGPLVNLAEHWDDFVKSDWDDEKFSHTLWFDSIPMESFPLFKGPSQQYAVWRPGLLASTGLADWEDIPTSRTAAGNDPGLSVCDTYNPVNITFGGNEIFRNSGKRLLLKSPTICVQDLRNEDEAPMQIGLRVQHMLKHSRERKIAWTREQYIQAVMMADHGYIMTPGGVNPTIGSGYKWYYDPYTAPDGETYMYFPAGVRVSTLNWNYLIDQQRYLQAQCAGAATGNMDGMPVFTAYGDTQDMMDAVLADSAVREDFRYARAELLLGDYRKFTAYRGIAMAHDLGQMRFEEVGIVDGTSVSDGRGGTLGNTNWVKCKRISPEREGRTIMNGAKATEANPDYFTATYRVLPIFMNKVYIQQVGTKLENLGNGLAFGPTPGYNGEFSFHVIPDAANNPFSEKGNFFARFEYFVKPDRYYADAVAFLYVAVNHETVTLGANAGTATGATTLAKTAVAADVDITNFTITVETSVPLRATVGDAVTVTEGTGASGTPSGYILDASNAPIYVIGFTSMSGFTESTATDIAADLDTAATVTVN